MAAPTAADKYEVLEKIGHGSFGLIRKVKRESDGFILCRKEISYIRMSQKEREQLYAEFSILSSLRHPNIVAYYHREHLKTTQDLHIYMEFCGGGDLSQTIDKLKQKNQYAEEPFVWSMFAQLVTALYRCHYGIDAPEVGENVMGPRQTPNQGLRPKNQLMILHRDLKPENVFLGEDNSVKLGDFGLSKLMQSHDFASTYVGTPFYMSPEICAAERYTLKSDIWSLGCIMYELCQRAPPFNAKSHFALVQKIKEGRVDPLPPIYSQELQSVIRSCLKTNSMQRPDTQQLLNVPMIRLMRKEREVVELGKILVAKEEQARLKFLEAEAKASSFETEKEKMRQSIEEIVRREWEVKARLEIDRRVQIGLEKLQKDYQAEVQAGVQAQVQAQVHMEVQKRIEILKQEKDNMASSPPDIKLSSTSTSASTSADTDFPSSTDLSSFSLDSPPLEKVDLAPPKKTARTPFTRARTQFDSPMDIQMGESSPMSIACLSLSPRRTAAASSATASNIPNSKNIFALAIGGGNLKSYPERSKLNQQQLSSSSPSPMESTTIEEDEDSLPDLPSPTRLPSSHQDPFKVPTARPGLLRQKTAPSRRLSTYPPGLFPSGPIRPPRVPSPPNTTASGSPVRKLARKPSAAGSDNEMFKAVMQRKAIGGGRTLVELQQARAGGAPSSQVFGLEKGNENGREPPVWDPELDEMPSPFLVRGGGRLRRP